MSRDLKKFKQDIEHNNALPLIFQNLEIQPAIETNINTENLNTLLDFQGLKYKKYECYKHISKSVRYEK